MAKSKGSDNLAMAREGSQYSDPNGRYSLSWAFGRDREVIAIPPDERDGALERHIVEGSIVEVDDAPNTELAPTRPLPPVLTGKEAAERLAEPPPEDGVQFRSFRINEPAAEGTAETATAVEGATLVVEPDEDEAARGRVAEGEETAADEEESDGLDNLKKAELLELAEAEGVDLAEASNNAERVTAIREARSAG